VSPPRHDAWRSVGWGLFLASSWTWCIGMYLPIILLREWGWRGFWLFAIVNVVGATAVGFLWTRERSREFVERRRSLLRLFSLATISFQAFFVAWMAGSVRHPTLAAAAEALGGAGVSALPAWLGWSFGTASLAALALAGSRGESGWRTLGAIVTLGSLALWWAYGVEGWSRVGEGAAPPGELWLLAPAIALGFLVCPHLDLSFQRVAASGAGPIAWIVFGASFLPMLLFAASAYSPAGAMATGSLVVWWFLQCSFTAMVHARELRASAASSAAPSAAPNAAPNARGSTAMVVVALLVGAIAGSPLLGGESIYLRFLGLYGAIFPAAALLLWRGYRSLGILGYLAVAVPCFEIGFIGRPGEAAGRIAWATLLPLGLLLGLVLAPINNGAGRGARAGAVPLN